MKKEYIYAGISIFMWSTVPTVSKLLLGAFTSFQVLCVSILFAGLFLLCVNIITGNIKRLKNYKPKDFIITVLIGLPGTFLYYVFYYTGTSMMLASQAFIINYLWPIMSVVFAWIILKEKMTLRKAIAIAMSFIGVIIVMGGDIASFNKDILMGAVLCVLAAVSYGIFTAFNQKYCYDKRISMMIFCFVSFILTLVINTASGAEFSINAAQLLGLAWNGVFSIGTATTLWAIALESGKTAKISNLAYITPFLSLVWTAIFLNEPISIYSIIGLGVIVCGIFIQIKDKKSESK